MNLDKSRPARSGPATSVLAYDIETIAPPSDDGAFPPWPLHRPVAIGFARAAQGPDGWSIDIDALVIGDEVGEAMLVREADRRMAGVEVVTGYNSRGFDALVLRLAAQRLRIWDLPALAEHAALPRFDGRHADLAELYASHTRKVSLAQIASEIGIPVKTSVSGGDVGDLWAAGETEKIRRYVMEDAAATLVLFHAWEAGRWADERLLTGPLAALARHIEADPDLEHLGSLVDCGLMQWARPRALRDAVSAALDRTARRLRRIDEERGFAA